MSQIKTNQFLELGLEQAPRLLGQLNSNVSSKTYGSFDRAYWHYRTNTISCARYQEATLTCALLYACDFEGNSYYHDERILDLVRASIRFTASIQHTNGSFDEWYLNEGSYVCTAFVTAAFGEILKLVKNKIIDIKEQDLLQSIVEKGAEFLVQNSETTVLNQVSGAIYAISLARVYADRSDFEDPTNQLLTKFLAKQSSEGWWMEYGGPDVGYLSLTVSYLTKYRKLTADAKVDEPITRAKKYILSFVQPDSTAGGEYMSRNTEYLIPSINIPFIGAVTPVNLDDRYLSYILYNWIQTGVETSSQELNVEKGETYFKESGTYRNVSSYGLFANAKKGNSFRLYQQEKVYFDSGLEITLHGKKLSTGILDDSNVFSYKDNILRSEGCAKEIKEPLLDTKLSIIFNSWQFLFGWIGGLQKAVKKFLRERMVSYANTSPVSFERTIEQKENTVIVTDTLSGVAEAESVVFGAKSSYNAVPSSKYASVPDLKKNRIEPVTEEKEVNGVYIIKRKFYFDA